MALVVEADAPEWKRESAGKRMRKKKKGYQKGPRAGPPQRNPF